MSDGALAAFAAQVGLQVRWTDAEGRKQRVESDTVKSVLRALGMPADSPAELRDSRARLRRRRVGIPPLIVARTGELVRVPRCRHAELITDSGTRHALATRSEVDQSTFRAPREPGYYRLEFDGRPHGIAIAPVRCVRPQDIVGARCVAGISLQIYSLRDKRNSAFGDFAALGSFARQAGRLGFDAVMASPAHALFGADPARFTPYSPSTRFFLNALFANPALDGESAGGAATGPQALIDWARSGSAKYDELRAAFARFRSRRTSTEFLSFCREGGQRLLAHALFEALDLHFRKRGIVGFGNWPRGFESPSSHGVRSFAQTDHEETEYQLFLQWLAARSASEAQQAARRTMQIGIIADIAVGMDPQGSHAWSAPHELLRGLHVGAPPDIFNPRGQDWGLTTLSPRALELSGYAPFIATLRAGMEHAGGIRIDHALGLRRLWVIPAGASPSDGVYLHYPQRELMNLVALESHRNRAIVIGEDLGTVPEGFRREMSAAGILGMQVLWFERDSRGRFTPPVRWRRDAAAMTTTHDLPTVAGWWSERDIDVQISIRRLRGSEQELRKERATDRKRLWSAFRRADCATGAPPSPSHTAPAVAAALGFVARTPCRIAFAPLEDIEGNANQPNLPGTMEEHANWKRRIQDRDILRNKSARGRLDLFLAGRRAS